MTELSLFTGAGGGVLGTKLLGWTTRGYVEYETYCQKIIKKRIADGLLDAAPIFGDIRAFNDEGYAESYKGMVDVVSGGFPCTDISVCGRKWDHVTGDITGERSGLWREMARTVSKVRPRYVFVENTPTLVSGGLAVVIGDLAQMGYDCRWGCLGADALGFPHHRSRLWLVADSHGFDVSRNCEGEVSGEQRIPGEQCGRRVAEMLVGPAASELFYHGVNDGVANYVDRIKATGNGQVPAVVAVAWNILTAN